MKKSLLAFLLFVCICLPLFTACNMNDEHKSNGICADFSFLKNEIFGKSERLDYLVVNDEVKNNAESLSQSIILGDADGDGSINSKDVLLCSQYLASKDPATGDTDMKISSGADANGDGKINVIDLIRIRQMVVSGGSDEEDTTETEIGTNEDANQGEWDPQ